MLGAVFDLDDFIGRCESALADSEPRRAVREVLERAVAVPNDVADVLRPRDAGISILHHAPDMTMLHVVWAPKMAIYPHNHDMWAAIGIYTGAEDNAFYRRSGPGERTLVESGGKRLSDGDTVLLGDDTIHGVTDPRGRAHRSDPHLRRRLHQPATEPVGPWTARGTPLRHRRHAAPVRRGERGLATSGETRARLRTPGSSASSVGTGPFMSTRTADPGLFRST